MEHKIWIDGALYELAASVFANDIGRAMRLSTQLEFGTTAHA